MAIPNDDIIKKELLKLLYNSKDYVLHCNVVYDELAKLFPELTYKEKTEKYQESMSLWANRVQWARQHLVSNDGYLLNASETKKALNINQNGFWKLSPDGEDYVKSNLLKTSESNLELKNINRIISDLEISDIFQSKFDPSNLTDARERTLSYIVQRRGQTSFRKNLLSVYNYKCAITNCDVPEALEASHIVPYLGEETNKIRNGILLRADIHTLFDLRLLTITAESYRVKLCHKLKNTFYSQYDGKVINLPSKYEYYPDKEALKKHSNESNL